MTVEKWTLNVQLVYCTRKVFLMRFLFVSSRFGAKILRRHLMFHTIQSPSSWNYCSAGNLCIFFFSIYDHFSFAFIRLYRCRLCNHMELKFIQTKPRLKWLQSLDCKLFALVWCKNFEWAMRVERENLFCLEQFLWSEMENHERQKFIHVCKLLLNSVFVTNWNKSFPLSLLSSSIQTKLLRFILLAVPLLIEHNSDHMHCSHVQFDCISFLPKRSLCSSITARCSSNTKKICKTNSKNSAFFACFIRQTENWKRRLRVDALEFDRFFFFGDYSVSLLNTDWTTDAPTLFSTLWDEKFHTFFHRFFSFLFIFSTDRNISFRNAICFCQFKYNISHFLPLSFYLNGGKKCFFLSNMSRHLLTEVHAEEEKRIAAAIRQKLEKCSNCNVELSHNNKNAKVIIRLVVWALVRLHLLFECLNIGCL